MAIEYNIETLTTTREGQPFDRKSARIDPKGLAVVLVALANADGGRVAIGIEDDGTVTGIARYIGNVNDLLRVPMDYCVPSINVHPEYINCTNNNGDADHVLILNVEQSNRLHATSADEAYIRVGDKSHKLGFEERMQLMFAKGVCYFEDEPVAKAGIEDLDLKCVEEYCARISNLRTTHFSRNPKIAQMLHEYEYVREFGEGIDRIYREMAEVGQPAPEFKQYDFMLRATIRKVAPIDDTQKTTQKTTRKTTQKIIEAITGNPNISIEELAVVCGISRDGINYNIRNLKKQGIIRRVGPDKGGHWEVIVPEGKDRITI